MKVIIIEDEQPAANRLEKLLHNYNDGIEIIHKADSIESSVRYLAAAQNIDLIFMDIQLADGLSFDIFDKVKIAAPVIFTTAFDQYTLKAFKVNSIDYLLKPIDEKELHQSLDKYQKLYPKTQEDFSGRITRLLQEMNAVKYKERLLIKRGQQLSYLNL